MEITVAELVERLGNFNDDATLGLLSHYNGDDEVVLTEVLVKQGGVEYTIHVFGKNEEVEL